MPKSLRTFLDDMRRAYPSEVVSISKPVNPLTYDITAIVKQLGALKKFPVLIFEHPLNAHGQPTDMKVVMSAENSQKKIQVALGLPADMNRAEMARECLRREAGKIGPVIVSKDAAPVKEIIQTGDQVDLYELPLLKHHEMDGGPYIDMSSVAKDRNSGVYNCSYHRMEVKDRNHTGFLMTLQHMWRIFRGYEEAGEECPVATVIGHHPAYQMGACYGGPFDISEYDIIGGYMQEPLRLTPSETWGERLLVPADAEIVIEGALLPGKRMVEGPFGEVNGYLGVQGYQQSAHYEVRAITRRRGAHAHVDPYARRRQTVDGSGARGRLPAPRQRSGAQRAGGLHQRRHALLNVFISMKKISEGDPGRAAAAVLTWDWCKNVFVFDEDINVYDPTEILWAIATRVQPHLQVSIIKEIMRGSLIDPSMVDARKTSAMIVDATKPLDRPFSPVSKCPDDAMARIRIEDFVPGEVLQHIPIDRTTYWA